MKCHQRKIREEQARLNPRPVVPLTGCYVDFISKAEAKKIILKYEWLGTMGKAEHCVGLLSPDKEILGVACFGQANGTKSHNVCGEEYKDITICLERGTCVHYAHEHAGSFLVSRACKFLVEHTEYRIFFAYSDHEAGEIGTIYQACNWHYLGISPGRAGNYRLMIRDLVTGEEFSTRTARNRGLYMANINLNPRYSVRKHMDKGKYVWCEGNKHDKKEFRNKLVHPIQKYPKRED